MYKQKIHVQDQIKTYRGPKHWKDYGASYVIQNKTNTKPQNKILFLEMTQNVHVHWN